MAAPEQRSLIPRAPEQAAARHGSTQAHLAAFTLLPPAPALSPDLLVRPFQSMLSTPERDARMLRSPGVQHQLQRHQANPEYVHYDGYGLVERVRAPQSVGALSQRFAAAAPPRMDSEASAAQQPQPQQTASVARKPLLKKVPELRTMQDVPEFWQTWQVGNGMEQAPLKDLAAELIRPQKQRYLEWSKAARALEHQAEEQHVTPEQMAVTLDAIRVGEGKNVASFMKALGSKWLAEQRAAEDAALQVVESQE